MEIKITASNFGYDVLEAGGCPHCLWLSARKDVKSPSGFFSAAIRELEKNQREIFKSRNLKSLNSDFPDGIVEKSLGRPSTAVLDIEGAEVTLSGQYDHLVKLTDGDYALVSFKTSDPTKNIDAISRQLNALAFIVGNHKKSDEARKVVKLGVCVFDTNAFDRGDSFYQWYPVDLDTAEFESRLNDLVVQLKGDMPDYSADCDYCKYQKKVAEVTKELATV